MLKWTVMNKRENMPKSETRRRSTAGICTIQCDDVMKPAKPKRRRSSASRRSSTSRRSAAHRNSLCLDLNKENKFTSTPIKSEEAFQSDAFRDVSNLTPKDNACRRTLSAKKINARRLGSPNNIPKKKKQCVDPSHSQDFFNPDGSKFRHFETVDSHIEGITSQDYNDINCACSKTEATYAPTLPSRDYPKMSPQRNPLRTNFNITEICPPNKRTKIDHVNDFLQQISIITSPEEGRMRLPTFNVKVSPLVKRLVDLRFSKIEDKLEINDKVNDSSFINELSLDKIVDAILDDSLSYDTRSQVRENELNETQEENLLNTEQERNSFSDRNSTDSGFRSTTTESHDFLCKCNNNHAISDEMICDKTIINIDGTFNERCVDVTINNRKRSCSSPKEHVACKRMLLDQTDIDFTLKRQKGIRRRRLEEAKKVDGNDNSFDSSISETNSEKYNPQETYLVDTPEMIHPCRSRKFLSFESTPSGESSIASTPRSKGRLIHGNIELDMQCHNDELTINIFRCVDLKRANSLPINAYVKVAFSEKNNDGRRKQKGSLQRTAVQADSSCPVFNHTFKIPVQKNDYQKLLYVEVWHRDRCTRRSEFLGCLSFIVKNAIKKNISGLYRLLPQSTNRCEHIPISANLEKNTTEMCESQSSVDEVFGFDEIDSDLKKSTKPTLSQQQKDADENLFLRYLELDPTEGPDAAPAAAQRKATGNKDGRTPFTSTKLLRRMPKTGFGFSVVWTHPPRIERVEKGLPADKAGIVPGDYLIFVDKHNVVMMPEIDILNLIRSFGNTLTLEIFRRTASRNGSVPNVRPLTGFDSESTTGLSTGFSGLTGLSSGFAGLPTGLSACIPTGLPTGISAGITSGIPAAPSSTITQRRPSTVCSTNTASVEYNRKKLHLPQVTFSSERPTNSADEARRKAMYQIITREQQYATCMQFAMSRFVSALAERKELLNPNEHRILFQNSEELLRLSEDILDNLVTEDGDYQPNALLRTYHSKVVEITSSYKKYCSGIKKADCVLANVTKNQEFMRFLQTPAIPRRRPDITVFIHKPLEHYREILKLFNVILSHTKPNNEDYIVINQIVHELQVSYREMTSEAGLMEPMGEGRPLLSVQDLENRLVFTKCKPFVLSKPGRQWIFGGDLSRVEGRTVRQYWALLFSDILLFAKVSRDRVLFILEDPLPLVNISDIFFNVRKKEKEFRIIIEPGGKQAVSPTVHCGPDLSRTPRKNPTKRCVILRTPTVELKAVWQNLLQRQIFHVNAGMDGSSYSSPLESPEAPITSSVVTLQSAESLSYRRQTPRNINCLDNDHKKQIDELIEHKCKQLEKSSSSSKSNAIHLEQWMKGQFGDGMPEEDADEEQECFELWTDEQMRKRSEELRLIDTHGNPVSSAESKRCESRCEDITFSDQDQSPSRSTNTTESQVTVRSSPLVPETVSVCRQCHKTCMPNHTAISNKNYVNSNNVNCKNNNHPRYPDDTTNQNNEEDDWRPLMLMGLTALNPAATLVKLDPFAAPLPKISVLPPTPELQTCITQSEYIPENNCSCQYSRPQVGELVLNKDYDNSPDDSPLVDEQPYHSLNSSNLTLRRFGTVSSLERMGSEDETFDAREDSSDSEGNRSDDEDEKEIVGIDNEAFNNSSIMSWTARAGSFVAEKMAFLERLGDDYRSGGRFFERYLKNENNMNGDDVQEEETSGATSGEEIWGTPTSGGELDDPLSSPNYDGHNSPTGGGSLSSNEDTELMMDELLMTPPVTSANIRGLLPRRTLEPLMEEEYSDTYSSSSSTHTEPSPSPEQGNGTGDAADKCSPAAEKPAKKKSFEELDIQVAEYRLSTLVPTIHRSESYRRIIEQEDDNIGFFTRFRNRPSMKFVNIERIPPTKGVKFLEFFNVRRERKIYETFPGGKHLIKVFSREGDDSDDVPTSYSEKPESIRKLKERQLDRRFWKQLSKRRSKPVQLTA